jgi:nucleotide-binding universal stress UspA family protein
MSKSISNILVATDFSDASNRATAYAFELARALNSGLYLMHVVPASDVDVMVALQRHLESQINSEALIEAYYADAEKQLDAIVAQHHGHDLIQERLIVTGNVVDEIVSWAQGKKVDIIIVGTHGRSGLEHALIGSVAERVVRQAQTAVLVIPPTS